MADVDYAPVAARYARRRRADPRIAAFVHAALGGATSVLNVGAGAGSYEPADRWVLAVEPSAAMRAVRPFGLAPAIDAVAERLPLDDDAVDAAMASVTVHQWDDVEAGLRELRRVARGPVAILTFDPDRMADFWLAAYLPELATVEASRYPALERVVAGLGGAEVEAVPIPADCSDGFVEAYFARPEALLDPDVRAAQSLWSRLDPGTEERCVAHLEAELASGAWDERFGASRDAAQLDGSLRLVVSRPGRVGDHPER